MRREPQGFVLIAVIWFIALTALVVAIIGNWVSSGLQGFAGCATASSRSRSC